MAHHARHLVAAAFMSAVLCADVSAQSSGKTTQKSPQLSQLPDRGDPAFEASLTRTVRLLGDPDPAVRVAASRVLSNSRTLSASDLLQQLTPGTPLESRWRLLEAAEGRFRGSERAALGVSFGMFDGYLAIRTTTAGFDCHDRGLLLPGDTVLSIAGVDVLSEQADNAVFTNSALRRIQPAIVSHDPGSFVEVVVSRVTDPEHAPTENDLTNLEANTDPTRPLSESKLPRELVTLEIQLGSFSNLRAGGAIARPHPSVLDYAWQLRLDHAEIDETLPPLASLTENPLNTLTPIQNVAIVVGELQTIFPNAAELAVGWIAESLTDKRDTERQRMTAVQRFGARPIQAFEVQQQRVLNRAGAADVILDAEFQGLPRVRAGQVATHTEDALHDPRLASLLNRAAMLDEEMRTLSSKLRDTPIELPAHALLEARMYELRHAIASTRSEIDLLSPTASEGAEVNSVRVTTEREQQSEAGS